MKKRGDAATRIFIFTVLSGLLMLGAIFYQQSVSAQKEAKDVLIPAVCTAPPSGLVASYRGENNAFDSHSNADGAHSGAFQPSNYASGKVGAAFNFDNTRVEIPDNPAFRNQNFTLEAWVNFAWLGPGLKVIIGKSFSTNDSNNSFVLHYDPATQTLRSFSGSGLSYPQLAVPFSPTVGTWYHVAQTFDGAAQKIYINGALAGTFNQPITIPYDSSPITIGGERVGNNYLYPFFGQIDEVGIYNTVLTPAAIQAIYDAGTNGKCTVSNQVRLSLSAYSVNESAGKVSLSIRRPNASQDATVNYATSDGSAIAGQDYTQTAGTLNFAVGEAEKTITIPVMPDTLTEGIESFNFTLSNPSSGLTLGTPATANVSIQDPNFIVNLTSNEADSAPGDGNCDTDPTPGAQCTLRAAIQEANAAGTADVIYVLPGTYTFSSILDSGDGGMGGSALPRVTSPITIQGESASSTIIERSTAAGVPNFRLFYVKGSNAFLTLGGLTVRNGVAPNLHGGAIATHEGRDVTINDCVFANNSAPLGFGGAITPVVSSAKIIVNNSTFTGNSSRDGAGAIGGDFQIINNSTFSGNTTPSSSGGAVGTGHAGSVFVSGSTFEANSAHSSGGAISGGSASFINVENSTFNANSQTNPNTSGAGGAISGGNITVFGSRLANNTSQTGGGAISAPTINIFDSTLSGNSAERSGGAIQSSTVTLKNSTISGNSARQSGGAIVLGCCTAVLNANNSTITNNTADSNNDGDGDGGGIHADSGAPVLNIKNTILAGNNRNGSPDCSERFGRTYTGSQGYNLIGNTAGCNFTAAPTDLVGTGASPINPLLAPLADNGGLGETHALLPNSPVIDAGNPATPDGANHSCLPMDQRGAVRPSDGNADGVARCDIGAFETVPPVPTQLRFISQPTDITAGNNFSPPIQVGIFDQYGNLMTDASAAITISVANNPPGGTLGGTLTQNTTGGVAVFSDLSLSAAANGYTLRATAGGLTQAVSDSFNVAPGLPQRLGFTVQPADTKLNFTISPAVQVAVQDQFGNTITGANNSITLSLVNNPGGGTLGGTLTRGAVGGIAVFNDLSINRLGDGYALQADSANLTSALSNSFNITRPIFVVTKTADTNDGICNADCSLREAITAANALTGADTIHFNIPGSAPFVISISSNDLPPVTETVTIDGMTQPGFVGSPVVAVVGSFLSGGVLNLVSPSNGNVIRGLRLSSFKNGINIGIGSNYNIIEGNFIGTDISGSISTSILTGIRIQSSNNIIGGISPISRNLIYGRARSISIELADNNQITGNFIDVNAAGTTRLASSVGGFSGIYVFGNNNVI